MEGEGGELGEIGGGRGRGARRGGEEEGEGGELGEVGRRR